MPVGAERVELGDRDVGWPDVRAWGRWRFRGACLTVWAVAIAWSAPSFFEGTRAGGSWETWCPGRAPVLARGGYSIIEHSF